MRLKRLEIYGFKSFADRTVVLFDNGITGIVGPNGSGKSNLSDAVRWVLGEQSAKALRGGKMEDVIFNGTQKRKRLGYCEVSLVFDNEDHALPVDFTEVMITRRVYRSGEGEYYINKASCRLKDIIELFRDTGVGKEGYSIIGQGRIGEILSQKSEDRRGIFEEAAGIVKYRTRKEESEKRLSNMRDNLSRVEDIISELESQLEPLAKASETARHYLALRDELRILECSSFVLRSDRAKVRIEEAEDMLTGLREAIENEEKPDLTIALLHWGSEYNEAISKSQEDIAKLMIGEGVDVIIGSHPHLVQQIDFDEQNGTIVAYSLGDFFGDGERGGTNYAIILDMEITKDYESGTTKITNYSYTPIYTLAENQCDGNRRVVRIENAMSAYELNFVDKITDSCYENMQFAMERIISRVNAGKKTEEPKK